MATLKTNDVHVGMELAEPVVNPQGKVLINADNTIAEKHIKALKAWGVTEVVVKEITAAAEEEPANPMSAVELSALRTDVEKEVDYLFQITDRQESFTQELYRLAVEYRLDHRER
jgi:hypothetical protein